MTKTYAQQRATNVLGNTGFLGFCVSPVTTNPFGISAKGALVLQRLRGVVYGVTLVRLAPNAPIAAELELVMPKVPPTSSPFGP